jgi:hypothetical protein
MADLIDLNLTSDAAQPPMDVASWCTSGDAPTTTTADSLYFSASTADWVFQAARKLDKLARLEENWDSHRGLPLQSQARHLTVEVLDCLKRVPLPTPAVVLGSGGTVHLEWRRRGKELELGMGGQTGIEYLKVYPQGRVEEGEETGNLRSRVRDLTLWLLEG